MSSVQTSTAGKTRAQQLAVQYQPLGTKGEDQPRSAAQSMIVLLGMNGAGKSFITQSHPGCAVANFQMTPTTHPNPVCEMWPRDSGEPVAWPDFVDFVKYIVKANLEGQAGAPTSIAIDSYTDMMYSVRMYAAWKMHKRRNGDGATPFAEYTVWDALNEDGQAVWGLAYEWTKSIIAACRASYVGLIFTVGVEHIFVEYMKGREKIKEERMEPMATAKQFKIIRDAADALLYVQKNNIIKMEMVDKTVKLRGQMVTKPERVEVPGVRQVILRDYAQLSRYLKVRSAKLPLPLSIDVSDTGWAGFAEVWNKSAGVPAEGQSA